MNVTRDQIQDYILRKLVDLSQDWDNPTEIAQASLLFSDLGFESLDAVVLGVAIQEHFGRQLPFAELLAELGQQRRDLSVGELIDFVYKNLGQTVETQRV
jgi:acyl carrier protein